MSPCSKDVLHQLVAIDLSGNIILGARADLLRSPLTVPLFDIV